LNGRRPEPFLRIDLSPFNISFDGRIENGGTGADAHADEGEQFAEEHQVDARGERLSDANGRHVGESELE
jgi:hypothetical protein